MQSAADGRKRLVPIVAVSLVLSTALGIRLWHSRSVPPSGEASLRSLETTANAEPENGNAQLEYGLALRDAERFDDADVYLSRAAALMPNDPRPFIGLASVAIKQGNHKEMKQQIMRAATIAPKDPEVALFQGELYLEEGNLPLAVQAYLRATTSQPDNASAWKQLGSAYVRTTLLPNAYDAFARSVQLDPNDWEAQFLLADTALKLGYLKVAKEAADSAHAKRPADASLAALSAMIDIRLDASPQSLAQAESRIKALPSGASDAPILLVLGRIHLLQGRNEEAVTELKRAAELQPKLDSTHVFLSQAYSRMGRHDLARKASETVTTLMDERKTMMKQMMEAMGKRG